MQGALCNRPPSLLAPLPAAAGAGSRRAACKAPKAEPGGCCAAQELLHGGGKPLPPKLVRPRSVEQPRSDVPAEPGVVALSKHTYGCRCVHPARAGGAAALHCPWTLATRVVTLRCSRLRRQAAPQRHDTTCSAMRCGCSRCRVPDRCSAHARASRVIQRLLEFCTLQPVRDVVLGDILESCVALASNTMGNYVIQHVVQHGSTTCAPWPPAQAVCWRTWGRPVHVRACSRQLWHALGSRQALQIAAVCPLPAAAPTRQPCVLPEAPKACRPVQRAAQAHHISVCCRKRRQEEGTPEAEAENAAYSHSVIQALMPHMLELTCNKFGSNVVEVCQPCGTVHVWQSSHCWRWHCAWLESAVGVHSGILWS